MSHEHEGAGPMAQKNAREHASAASQKEWRQPVLRKLPIAATAGSKANGQRRGWRRQGRCGYRRVLRITGP